MPEAPGDGVEVGADGQELGWRSSAGAPSDAPSRDSTSQVTSGSSRRRHRYVCDAGSATARIGRGICQKMASANGCGLYLPSGFFG